MTGIEQLLRYDGKRALVVGGATGMGAAAAKAVAGLGAEVVVMDCAPIDVSLGRGIHVDLNDKASIDAGIEHIGGPVHAVFSAAGIADGPDLMRVNFIGHRHLIDSLLAEDLLPRGSAICFIASVAGMGWERNLELVQEFLATPDFDAADQWVKDREADGINNYAFAKQAVNAYVAGQGYPMIKKGIRINAICPGPTDTPLARANADSWLSFAQGYRDETGLTVHTPEQQGNTMVFLNSDVASGISGAVLLVDSGHAMASIVGAYEQDKLIMDLITGKASLS
jgi:NAD(P)-dependent dehydrogenase (short-subunit alcohol dehydrogenase family)